MQDNWHVTDRLTLNLGMRYDVDQPRTERYDRMSYFDPNASPASGLMGAVEYTGHGNPRTPFNTYYGAIGPRFGAAYRIGTNSTIRTGYGL